MIVLSSKLTTGEITFIFRVVIQILSYVGVYLLGRIVTGHAPRIAPIETHDLLNRFVGQSSTTMATLRWIWRRVVRKNRDPFSSIVLTFAFALALLYGLTVTVSDIGLIGIHSCTIAGPSYEDFPASIKSDSDALALVQKNLLDGTDPGSVNAYRCDAASTQDVPDVWNNTTPSTLCTSWHNSTFAEGSQFLDLNTTDSDVLMPRNLAQDSQMNDASLNIYLLATAGTAITNPMIQGGLAIIPHDTGVQMIVGVPQLSNQTKVDIPKTLALEIEVGCLSLGIFAVAAGAEYDTEGGSSDHFVPDSLYLPGRTSSQNYSGPDYLQAPLTKAADELRAALLPAFDPNPDPLYYPANGDYDTYGLTENPFSWPFQVLSWAPSVNNSLVGKAIMSNCTSDVQNILGIVAGPQEGVAFPGNPSSCNIVLLSGSQVQNNVPWQRHEAMVCATTTQVNMVSATLEVDENAVVTGTLTRLPSDINIVQSNFGQEPPNRPANTTPWFDPLVRFSLSDNPGGHSQHYIYQELPEISSLFSQGSGNIGAVFVHLASNIWSFSDPASAVIDPNYFSANFSAAQLTKWAGGLGASYILGSVGYNGWAARGSKALTVISTGGHPATCYSPWYTLGFVPLLVAAMAVFIWALVMLMTHKMQRAIRFEENYGGLSPHVDLPYPGKLPPYTWLEWIDDPEPHLKPSVEKIPVQDMDSEEIGLVSRRNSDEGVFKNQE